MDHSYGVWLYSLANEGILAWSGLLYSFALVAILDHVNFRKAQQSMIPKRINRCRKSFLQSYFNLVDPRSVVFLDVVFIVYQ